mmetsp:Transcript_60444/g.68923  ORF Transcript_60444/g.68923 Transcript_60444/m.68923 type:complete len:96 (+) Transcript_60444:974-1261(+)
MLWVKLVEEMDYDNSKPHKHSPPKQEPSHEEKSAGLSKFVEFSTVSRRIHKNFDRDSNMINKITDKSKMADLLCTKCRQSPSHHSRAHSRYPHHR